MLNRWLVILDPHQTDPVAVHRAHLEPEWPILNRVSLAGDPAQSIRDQTADRYGFDRCQTECVAFKVETVEQIPHRDPAINVEDARCDHLEGFVVGIKLVDDLTD